MRRRLDLKQMLHRYQKSIDSNPQKQYICDHKSMRSQSPGYTDPVVEYYHDTDNHHPLDTHIPRTTPQHYHTRYNNNKRSHLETDIQAISKFQMSREECEILLLKLKEELNQEQRDLREATNETFRKILRDYEQQQERLKREVLAMLEQAFLQNSNRVKHELQAYDSTQSPRSQQIQIKIDSIHQQLDQHLSAVRSSHYKRAISQVVLRDWESEFAAIQRQIDQCARETMESSTLRPDEGVLSQIRHLCGRLFVLTPANYTSHVKNEVSFRRDPSDRSDRSPVKSHYLQKSNTSLKRTRKPFFNFKSNHY